ncbi:thiamine-binding protein [Eubacteriaceae bacterium ES2]|nr:thiamine-binding protein [Eubacteriaceae bacterium ES2]
MDHKNKIRKEIIEAVEITRKNNPMVGSITNSVTINLVAKIAEVIKVIKESGLPYRMNSMFTEIECEWNEVMRVVKDASFVLAQNWLRTEMVLKADIRPRFTNTMTTKVDKVNKILGDHNASI